MKKIGTILRESSERELKNRLKGSSSVFIVGYSGIGSNDLNTLRGSLKGAGAQFFVSRNSMVKRVFQKSKLEDIVKFVQGPCGFVFSEKDPIDTSKILNKFSKDNNKLLMYGGIMDEKVLESRDIDVLASLPSRDMLYAMVVSGLKSPITASVNALKQLLSKLVIALDKIKENKEKTGGK